MSNHSFIGYKPFPSSIQEIDQLYKPYIKALGSRRSVRHYSDRPVEEKIIREIISLASSAPSGANKQPWHFVAIQNRALKAKIREAAEEEERAFYGGRAGQDWLDDLKPFGTDWQKPFLEQAPWLIAVFRKPYDIGADGQKKKNYYVQESVGIACGFLITAIHMAGLVTLTHTPSPMNFLSDILGRPENEKPFLLLPVGYPAQGVQVPEIAKKNLSEVATFK